MEGLAVPFEGIAQGIASLGKHFTNILDYLNPFSDNFLGKKIVEMFASLFENLFIPTGDQFSALNTKMNEKFGFIEQIKELVYHLFSTPSTLSAEEYPTWKITYEGTTVNIVDFTAFDKFRGILHGIIISIMYVSFFLRLYRRLPGIIGGYYVESEGGKK